LSFLSNINQAQLLTAVTMAVSRDAPDHRFTVHLISGNIQ